MTKTRWGVLVVTLFTLITLSEGFTARLAAQTATGTIHGRVAAKPTASRHASRLEEERRRLIAELYEIAAAPMPLRAGRAGLLFDRLFAEDEARRIAAIERLRPRRRSNPVPVLIASHGELNSGRPGS
ncbi:MAG: hypothetical protein V4558_09610 [Gemmatimonadota bacterium]